MKDIKDGKMEVNKPLGPTSEVDETMIMVNN
jgi:hypothetical protein